MSEYYEKDKFTGNNTPPSRAPNNRRKEDDDNTRWYIWPIIIVCFSVGAWPIALALLLYSVFRGNNSRKKNTNVERAVNDAVERAISKAAGKVEGKMDQKSSRKSAVEESLAKARAAAADQEAKKAFSDAVHQNVFQDVLKNNVVAQTNTHQSDRAKTGKAKKVKLPGKTLRILGIIFLSIGAIVGLSFLGETLSGGYADMEEFVTALGFLGAGGLMWGRGHYLANTARRSQRYIMAIGNVDAMPIDEIAKRVNRSPEKTMKELQKLIDKGYLGEDTYIDHERGYFLRFGVTLDREEPAAMRTPPPPPPPETQEGYSGILRSIRRANDRIADEELSQKIDRLEQVSASIFKEVEEHPEKKDRIHTFFDYYLPTTQKLLDTYADFEETGVEGENLRGAKERIEQIMDAIVEGFEHQLDQLYTSDAMDVASDITVMETMLQQDLSSVAKDFGFPPPPDPQKGRKNLDNNNGNNGNNGNVLQL